MLLIMDLSRGEDDPKTKATVNFEKAKANGVAGCYFRIVNGAEPDATYPIFKKNCEGILPWGGFGVLRPLSEGVKTKTQAEAFIDTAGASVGQLPIWFDWEVEGATWQQADEYIAILESAYPKTEIIIYSRSEYLKRMLPNRYLQATKYNRFAKMAVAQAQYQAAKPDALPAGFVRAFWQFTDRADASLYGITEAKGVDMSYFDGTLEEYQARFNLGILAPPVVTQPPSTSAGRISSVTVTITLPDGTAETWGRP